MRAVILTLTIMATVQICQSESCKTKIEDCWKLLAYCKCTNDLTAANQAAANLKDLQKKVDDLKTANSALTNGFTAKDQQISDLKTQSDGLDTKITLLGVDLKKATTYADDCRQRTILLSVNDLNAQRKFTTTDTVACEPTQATLECITGNVKPIKSVYGRTDYNTCVIDLVNNNCDGNANDNQVVTTKCTGLSTCVVPANNAVFGDPCGTVTKNLNCIYSCG